MFHCTVFHLPLLKVIVYDLNFKGQVFPGDDHSHTITVELGYQAHIRYLAHTAY